MHQRDNDRLLATLKTLRDLGNTLIVIEHDEDTMREADVIVDIGPGAGAEGGEILTVGPIDDVIANPRSLTGAYLAGRQFIAIPYIGGRRARGCASTMRTPTTSSDLNVDIPLGVFACVTGVSGSGKSSWSTRSSSRRSTSICTVNRPAERTAPCGRRGARQDGRDRPVADRPDAASNPATYTGAFDLIRELYSLVPDSKMRGYGPGRFSFNVKGGRCEACQGDGIIKIEMHFLPDVYVPCEVCKGRRYNAQTLEIQL